jgi:signal transduction histidine kinase
MPPHTVSVEPHDNDHGPVCAICGPQVVLVKLIRTLIERADSASLDPASADTVFADIAALLAECMELSYASVRARSKDGDYRISSIWGSSDHSCLRFPIRYHGEELGLLQVARSRSGFSPAERLLLAECASGMAVALHIIRITARLRRARQSAIDIRHEERARTRRELHDGLGPVLTAAIMRVDAARAGLGADRPQTDGILEHLHEDLCLAVADVRRLARALRPSMLDELGGLLCALHAQATRFEQASGGALSIRVTGPPELHGLSSAVQVAAFRIASEALTNTARHSGARTCVVRIAVTDDHLLLDVTDDGVGLPEPLRAGVGLTSMSERAAELGGDTAVENGGVGTRVRARLPLREVEATLIPGRRRCGS